MSSLRFSLSEFAQGLSQTNAYLAVERPSGIVARANIEDDPEIYGGLFAHTQGFARLAVDERHDTVVLLAAKVADHLRGQRDQRTQQVRPTLEGLQKSYVLSALRHRPGGSVLPPDRAEYFKEKIRAYCDEMRRHNANMFTLYGVQDGSRTIFANNHVCYSIIEDKAGQYSVRFAAPLDYNNHRNAPEHLSFATSSTLVQKQLGNKLNRSEADKLLMAHWQKVSSRLWDHQSIHSGEGAYIQGARLLTQLGRYPRDHALGMSTAALVAGGFMLVKDAHLVAAVVAGVGALHAIADVTLKETFGRAVAGVQDHRDRMQARDILNYGFNEDALRYYLEGSPKNLGKLCAHIDLKKCRSEDFRFLTIEEVRGMLPQHASFEENLRPSSLRGLALHGDQRGFTSTALYPAPKTRINIYQSGMVTLKHYREDGKIDIFVTYRPEFCLREEIRLPQAYIDQINQGGTGIQHIVYDGSAPTFSGGFEQKPVTYTEMQGILRGTLYATPESSPTNYVPPIAQQFQAQGWACIAHYFSDASNDNPSAQQKPLSLVVPPLECIH